MSERPAARQLNRKQRIGLLLYSLGLLLGLILAVLTIWGDLEATLFDVLSKPDSPLTGLSCPILIAADQKTAVVKASLKNDSDRVENLNVWAHISEGWTTLIREEETSFSLQPGDEQTVEWPISAEDAAWNRIVLVRVGTLRNVPYRQRVGATCGVLVIPLKGINGSQIVVATALASLILLMSGMWLWGIDRRPLNVHDTSTRMLILAALTGAALLFGFLKLWLLGLLIIILILVLLVTFISS